MHVQSMRTWLVDRGGLVALVSMALLAWLAPPYIVGGDNAELVTVGAVGGVPHPSGYPLYILWLRLTSWLPGENAAHAAAVSTAVLGAASILVLHAACRAWGARPFAASTAVVLYAASPVVLRQHSTAEVFALNGLVVASVLWLSARETPARGLCRIALLGLVAGLGLSNHMTCVLVAPVGLLGVVRGLSETAGSRIAAAAVGLCSLAVGLVPYVYLILTPETAISWRPIDNVSDLVRHFLRLDYGGIGTFSPGRPSVPVAESLAALLAMLGRTWLWLPLVSALIVLVKRAILPSHGDAYGRWGWMMLAISVLVSGPLLITRFNVPPQGIGLAIVHRFHMLPALLLAIPVAVGLDATSSQLARIVSLDRPICRTLQRWGVVVLLGGYAVLASRSLPRHSPAVERAALNLLAPLPPGAVVLVSEDDLYFGSAYLQWVSGIRMDVTVVSTGQLFNPDYRARLDRTREIASLAPYDKTPSLTIAADVLAQGRPLFVDAMRSNIAKVFPTYPYGTVHRVLSKGRSIPPVDDVFASNRQIFEMLIFDYPRPTTDDDYAAHVHERYAYVWQLQARALRLAGFVERAAVADALAETLAPSR